MRPHYWRWKHPDLGRREHGDFDGPRHHAGRWAGPLLVSGQKLFSWLMYVPVVIPDIVMAVAVFLLYSLVISGRAVSARFNDHDYRPRHFSDSVCGHRGSLAFGWFGPGTAGSGSRFGRHTLANARQSDVPLIVPGVLSGAMLAFTLSLDDFVISFSRPAPAT